VRFIIQKRLGITKPQLKLQFKNFLLFPPQIPLACQHCTTGVIQNSTAPRALFKIFLKLFPAPDICRI
jgi:hypothetical protein